MTTGPGICLLICIVWWVLAGTARQGMKLCGEGVRFPCGVYAVDIAVNHYSSMPEKLETHVSRVYPTTWHGRLFLSVRFNRLVFYTRANCVPVMVFQWGSAARIERDMPVHAQDCSANRRSLDPSIALPSFYSCLVICMMFRCRIFSMAPRALYD